MKVNVEELSSVKRVLHVEIPSEEVTRELDSAYGDLRKNAKVKGFRTGKTPRSVLERLFKKTVHADIVSKLLQDSLMKALQETGLNIVGLPDVDPPDITPGEPFRYDAAVEVTPRIADVDLTGLALKKTLYRVGDAELEAQIKMLQKNLAQRKPIDTERPAQKGDFVVIDFEGTHNGEPFEATRKTENFMLPLGKGAVTREFDEHLTGMNTGETRTFPVTFPDDHPNGKLAGKELSFTVRLNEIREELLPDIDDALAKRLGNYDTLDDLKNEIADNLKQGYDKRTEQELNEQIFQALLQRTAFEVPDTLIDAELEGILRETERAYDARGTSLEEAGITRETMTERFRDTAEKQVKRHLLLDKIIDQEKLTLSDEQLEAGLAQMAETSKQPIESFREYYKANTQGLEYFKQTLLEKQVLDLILKQSTIEEIEPAEPVAEPKVESDKKA